MSREKHWGVERRRAPRVTMKQDLEYGLSLHGEVTVRLLDFSESGVLLASKVEMRQGDHAELRAMARADVVSVAVQIRHVSVRMVPRTGQRFCAGAAFLDVPPDERARLDGVLRTERI